MAINLLSTSVLSASTLTDSLSGYRGMDAATLNSLAQSGTITQSQVSQILSDASTTAGLPASSSAAASAAGLTATGSATNGSTATSTSSTDASTTTTVAAAVSDLQDNRLRLSALRGREADIYGVNDKSSNILFPLYATGGLMFPYTPAISVGGETDWTPHSLTHTNYDIYSYQRTPSATIGLSGKFTVQNQREGEYAIACIHFLRTMGKMYYGEQDSSDYQSERDQSKSNAGLPPPVLRLRGYGLYMFSDLKCVLKGYSFNFEENMDLVTVKAQSGGDVMLPAMFTLTISILLQQNATNLRKAFKLDDFRTGALLRNTKGWF